jgi:CubicO group peptidase (beta-lactamase class C family)
MRSPLPRWSLLAALLCLACGLTISGIWNQSSPQPLVFKRRIQATAEDVRTQLTQIDSLTAAAFAKNPIGSVTIGVVSGNQLVWTKSYGNADMEKHLAAGKDTVYRIGSITKMFTAVMLEQLADAGKVHLSDPVEKYFPEINTVQGRFANAPPITLIQLATHTAGLAREPDDTEKYVEGGPVSEWEKTLMRSRTCITPPNRARASFTPTSDTPHSARPSLAPPASTICNTCPRTSSHPSAWTIPLST